LPLADLGEKVFVRKVSRAFPQLSNVPNAVREVGVPVGVEAIAYDLFEKAHRIDPSPPRFLDQATLDRFIVV
jgi:hypothetical protein